MLPLRGKILNVASATKDKLAGNQQIGDLVQALGVGTGAAYREQDLRYDKIIIMTDADVDGAHIASLLITFFYRQMPLLIDEGHLYLAVPPLYKLSQGGKTTYARNDQHKEELLAGEFSGRGKVEISRFKGLGEMLPAQLKETTMDPSKRLLLQVTLTEAGAAIDSSWWNSSWATSPKSASVSSRSAPSSSVKRVWISEPGPCAALFQRPNKAMCQFPGR